MPRTKSTVCTVAATLVLAVLLPSPASAEAFIAARAGATGWGAGYGVDVGFNTTENTNVRLGITNADNDWTDTYDNINYKADYRLRTVSGLFDWRPMSGVFHLTAGAVYTSKNEPSLLASGSGLDIGGTIYPGTVTMTGRVQFDRDWGPYIGMGWGNLGRKEKGLLWTLDVGVAFVGDISVHLTESTGTVSPGDLRSEEQHLKDELRLMRYLPSLTAAVGWRF